MTTLVDTGRRAGWRGRLVWVALALSLTLNVCFVGGLIWTRLHRPPSPLARMLRLGHSLNLDVGQQHALDRFLLTVRTRGRFMRRSDEPLIAGLWTEIGKPAPDDAASAKLAEQVTADRRAFQYAASAALADFIKSLHPDQRARLAAIVKSPPDEVTHRFFQIVLPYAPPSLAPAPPSPSAGG